MFLDVTCRRNPALVEAAIALHRAGAVPSSCFVVDADAVARNALALAHAGRSHGLTLYAMTKQFGRNPLLARIAGAAGLDAVAVDLDEARVLHRHGVRVRHLGHLVQVPHRRIPEALAMQPDEITVFGVEQAQAIGAVAAETGRRQRVLLRVVGPDDRPYPGQRGGVPLRDVVGTAEALSSVAGVAFAGVTAFPCLLWDDDAGRVVATPSLGTLTAARHALEAAGMPVEVVNAPSVTCVATLHAHEELPEVPAMVHVTEVTHADGSAVHTLGGGFYARGRLREALVARGDERLRLAAEPLEPGAIDYYGTLRAAGAGSLRPGETVVYAFRSQAFVSRSTVAVVAGVGSAPVVRGLYDARGNQLGDDLLPLGPAAREAVSRCA
jgi:predicted amino acid racemase